MIPTHHPSQAWLLDYTLGHLNQAFETIVGAHIGACQQCREDVAFAESIGGEIISDLNEAPLNVKADYAKQRFDVEESHSSTCTEKTSRAIETVAAESFEHFVETYLNSSINALRWRSIGNGLKICRLSNYDDTRLWMLKAKPATVLPAHTHLGSELTMVLKGAYFCGSEIYKAGDIEDADEEITHQPVVTSEGECICLAVTEGNLQFESWLPRLLQPLIGI